MAGGEKLTYGARKEDSTGFSFIQIRTGSHMKLTKHDSSPKTIHKKVFMYMTTVCVFVKKEKKEKEKRRKKSWAHTAEYSMNIVFFLETTRL